MIPSHTGADGALVATGPGGVPLGPGEAGSASGGALGSASVMPSEGYYAERECRARLPDWRTPHPNAPAWRSERAAEGRNPRRTRSVCRLARPVLNSDADASLVD